MQCRRESFTVSHVKAIFGSKSYVHSCFQTLIGTAIVVMKEHLGRFFLKLIFENRLIRYANSLLLEDSRNVVYYDFQDNDLIAGCREKWMINWHSLKNESLFVK